MYRVLKPGGYAQLIEIGPEWDSGPRTANHTLFLDDFYGSKNMVFRCALYLADLLKVAEFTDVKSENVIMNLGKWAGEDGILGSKMLIGAWKAMRDSIMREYGLGRFALVKEYENVTNGLVEEWGSIEGSHTFVRAVVAHKPL